MTQEEKEILGNCFVILKGAYNMQILEKSNIQILKTLEKECLSHYDLLWRLIDENKELKKRIEILEY